MTGSAGLAGHDSGSILWDVVEEHLDEAEFVLVQLARLLEHPVLTLADLGQWHERLAVHVDGLVVGGPPVIERLVAPELQAADAPERVTACALALLEAGELGPLDAVLGHPQEELRRAAALACALTKAGDRAAQTAAHRVHSASSAYEQAGLLDVLATRGAGVPNIAPILDGNDPVILPSALRAARFCEGPELARSIERHLSSGKPVVLEAAIVAALAHQSALALEALEGWASTAEGVPAPLLALLAVLGGPRQHALIARLAESGPQVRAAVFALGYSGNLSHMRLLLERLRGGDETLAKIAAQSLSSIFGLDLASGKFELPPGPGRDAPELPPEAEDPEAMRALPALEDDDLDELPLPVPEDALPTLDLDAIESAVARLAPVMQPGKRHLGGQLFTRPQLLHMLTEAPLRTRHTLAEALFVDTGRRCHIDTRTTAARQRQQLERARQHLSGPRQRYPLW